MQPVWPALPKFKSVRDDIVPAPMWWAWNAAAALEFFLKLLLTGFNCFPVFYWFALGRGPGTYLTANWPAMKIFI